MTLLDMLIQISDQSQSANQPADLEFGTVTGINPLEVTRDTQQAPLLESVLVLTSAVIEKKIPVLAHQHYISTLSHNHSGQVPNDLTEKYLTEPSLVSTNYDPALQTQNIICYENNEELPVENGFIILNRALAVGDRVVLMKVQHGQKFIILSRVFEEINYGTTD